MWRAHVKEEGVCGWWQMRICCECDHLMARRTDM